MIINQNMFLIIQFFKKIKEHLGQWTSRLVASDNSSCKIRDIIRGYLQTACLVF